MMNPIRTYWIWNERQAQRAIGASKIRAVISLFVCAILLYLIYLFLRVVYAICF